MEKKTFFYFANSREQSLYVKFQIMFIEVLTAFSRTEFVIYKLFSTSRIGLFWPMLQSAQAVRKINTVRIPTDFFWKTSLENYNESLNTSTFNSMQMYFYFRKLLTILYQISLPAGNWKELNNGSFPLKRSLFINIDAAKMAWKLRRQ